VACCKFSESNIHVTLKMNSTDPETSVCDCLEVTINHKHQGCTEVQYSVISHHRFYTLSRMLSFPKQDRRSVYNLTAKCIHITTAGKQQVSNIMTICLFSCLFIQQANQILFVLSYIVISGLSGTTIFFKFISRLAKFLEKNLLNTKCVRFSPQL